MIKPLELSLQQVFLLPMCAHLLFILACSAFYATFRRGRVRSGKARIYRCGFCEHVFIDGRKVPASICPSCRKLNHAVRGG